MEEEDKRISLHHTHDTQSQYMYMYMYNELTARYGRQPISVLAKELTNSPEMPKSHSLISPFRFMRMLDGLTSEQRRGEEKDREDEKREMESEKEEEEE